MNGVSQRVSLLRIFLAFPIAFVAGVLAANAYVLAKVAEFVVGGEL